VKRVLFLFLLLTITVYAKSEVATKDDIRAIRDDIKILTNQIDRRFEQVDKRFDLMQKYMDKRFEQIDKRFEQIDKRFEQVDKRFEQADKRFEQVESRFRWVMGIMLSGFAMIFLFLLKEHKLLKDSIEKELKRELEQKADKSTVEKIVSVIEEYARKDEDFREILEKHHLKLVV